MSRTLIIVESPAKAKKIQGYLDGAYRVQASIGHICDLPRKSYGVDKQTFEEEYEVQKADVVANLKKIARSRDFTRVLLATDPDREGEAIAWHLHRELGLNSRNSGRIEFREITPAAIQASLSNPRDIDYQRVDAQRARRVLDRIVGFDVSSEICWPAGAQSAGRVQTPALHILCEREREILNFVPVTYWTLGVEYEEGFKAFVPDRSSGEDEGDDGDDGDDDGQKKGRIVPRKFESRAEAEAMRDEAARHAHAVTEAETKRKPKRPSPPYTTSTLQQDASRKLKISAKQTMDKAQALFDNGLITYHRTDSTRLSEQAVELAREYIGRVQPSVLPDKSPTQRVKAGAQDAHEAIRPTKLEDEGALPPGTQEIYDLIKARFLASQCKPALFDRTRIWIESGTVEWVAEGSVLIEQGFLYFWGPYARQNDDELPTVTNGQQLSPDEYAVDEKQTSPPGRYDTGSLIRKLETSGVGRPATFASIIETLLRRSYVEETKVRGGKTVLQPTEHGLKVDGLLTACFPRLVSEEYTADMEGSLDRIERGDDLDRVGYLKDWFAGFRDSMDAALPRAAEYRQEHGLKARSGGGRGEETDVRCDRCGEANYLKIPRKKGSGSFYACPECEFTRSIRVKVKVDGCPKCGSTLVERSARGGNKFFGCVRYGMDENPCDHTENLDGKQAGRWVREETGKTCPRCTKRELVLLKPREGVKGNTFYACEDRSCGFTLDQGARRRKDPCPTCEHMVIQRNKKPTPEQKKAGEPGEPFWACAQWPKGCDYTADV